MTRGALWIAGLAATLFLLLTTVFLIAEASGLTDESVFREVLLGIAAGPGGRAAAAAAIAGLLLSDLVLPVPSSILMTLSGYLLGTAAGTAVSFAGAMAGAWVGFALCRRFGRPGFQRLLGADELPAIERFFSTYGAVAILLSRPVPMLTEVMSCLAGLSEMSAGRFLLLSAAGTLPISAVYAWAGDRAQGDASLWWPLLIALVLPLLGFLIHRALIARWG